VQWRIFQAESSRRNFTGFSAKMELSGRNLMGWDVFYMGRNFHEEDSHGGGGIFHYNIKTQNEQKLFNK